MRLDKITREGGEIKKTEVLEPSPGNSSVKKSLEDMEEPT